MEEAMSWLYLIPGLICLIIGAGFLLLFRYSNTKENELGHRVKAKAWAKLIDTECRIEDSYNNRTRTVYFGIYEYDTDDGQHISSASAFGYTSPDIIPGAKGNMVNILYNPDKPSEFVLPEEQEHTASILPTIRKAGITFIVIGVPLTVLAVAGILGLFDPILKSLLY